jgi:hypothetical protein
MVATDSKSCKFPILLVAWRRNKGSSSANMPSVVLDTDQAHPAISRTALGSTGIGALSTVCKAGRSTPHPQRSG